MSLLPTVHGRGTTAAKPAAAAANEGYLYQDTTLGRLERSNGATWDVIGGTSGGVVATDTIWDAAGDLVVGTGADAAARLAIGATNGMVLMRVGGSVAWALPQGHEFDYVQITSDVSITATTEGTANTLITGSSVTYDGSTRIKITVYCARLIAASTAGAIVGVLLFEGATCLGTMATQRTPAAASNAHAGTWERFITPTAAAHTYTIKGLVTTGTGVFSAGAGGTGADMPAFLQITKA